MPGMVRLSTFYDPDGTPWMLAQTLDEQGQGSTLSVSLRASWSCGTSARTERSRGLRNLGRAPTTIRRRRSSGRSTTTTFRRTGSRATRRGATFFRAARLDERLPDVERFLTGDRGRRVHASPGRVARRGAAPPGGLRASELLQATFERYDRAAGYWVSREPVEPLGTCPHSATCSNATPGSRH